MADVLEIRPAEPSDARAFLADPAVRLALSVLVDRASVQEQIYGRTGIATANFLNAPARFGSPNTR